MHLRHLRITNQHGFISILDGRVLEVFRDRRVGPAETRLGDDARRRKPPAVMEAHLGTGRIWVAKGWLAVDSQEAARFPKAREMSVQHPEFDVMHVTSLRSNHALATRLNLEQALVFDFYALLLPTPMQLERLRNMRLIADQKSRERI